MTDLGRRKRYILAALAGLAGIAILVSITFGLFLGLARVKGDDMLPALGENAGVIVRRRALPERGDLVLFEHEGVMRIRRVIGMPGEHLELDGMVPIVDGERATYEDRYAVDLYGRRMKVQRETIRGASHDVIDDPRRRLKGVPSADTGTGYYVMADFREYGNDSRTYGIVQPEQIAGVVMTAWTRGDRPEPVAAEPAKTP